MAKICENCDDKKLENIMMKKSKTKYQKKETEWNKEKMKKRIIQIKWRINMKYLHMFLDSTSSNLTGFVKFLKMDGIEIGMNKSNKTKIHKKVMVFPLFGVLVLVLSYSFTRIQT